MNWSIGVCVNKDTIQDNVWAIIDYATQFQIECIIIGEGAYETYRWLPYVRTIPFHEGAKPKGWITRKKNILAQAASYENLCIVHDYYKFDDEWAYSMREFDYQNPHWRVMSNQIYTSENYRHSDWIVNPDRMQQVIDSNSNFGVLLEAAAPHENAPKYVCGVPDDVGDLTHIQYISGGYIVCKRRVLLENPFNQDLCWGDAEDVEWSRRLNDQGILFHFNPTAIVDVMKPNKWRVTKMPMECVEILREYYGSKPLQ